MRSWACKPIPEVIRPVGDGSGGAVLEVRAQVREREWPYLGVTSASQRDGWAGATFCPLCLSPDWKIQILQFPEEEEPFV